MKRIIKGLAISLVAGVIFLSPVRSVSASTGIVLERVEKEANVVEVSIDNFNYEAKSFQLELKIVGDVTLADLKWSEALNKSVVNKNYIYNKDKNTINIYVTSKENLVEFSKLPVCTLTVNGEANTTYNIVSGKSFKYIYSNKNKEGKIDEIPSDSEVNFNYVYKDNNTEKPDGSEKPDGTEKPDEGEKPSGDENQESDGNLENQGKPENTGGQGNSSENGNSNSNNSSNKSEVKNEDESKDSKGLYTGDIIGAVVAISGVSLAGAHVFRPKRKNESKK
ncbi:MAG: hypothetical protein E6940_02505 [Clostridium septicum]|uniref:hypothetical protein n=1 Tax=Clostridium septicum TaxID=1504 RepID=UPI0025879B88|nr:hypothetical protein [Clostridium septicum]MDU1312915.1 hypothetical protein [Clostridium septicum]